MQQLLTGKKRLLDDAGKTFEGEWDWVTLDSICDVKGGKRLPKGKALLDLPTPHPYIRVTDMYMGGIKKKEIKYVPIDVAPSIKNYIINKDDLFITVAGTLGLVGEVPHDLDGANLTENADKLTNIKCDKKFLLYVMKSRIIQRYIEAESTQNAQPKLALTRIRSFKAPQPALEEQQKISAVLSNTDKEIELLEQQLVDLKQEKKALMQQLLTGKRRVTIDEVEVA
jgi:type I restriction enzyme S subunit